MEISSDTKQNRSNKLLEPVTPGIIRRWHETSELSSCETILKIFFPTVILWELKKKKKRNIQEKLGLQAVPSVNIESKIMLSN